MPVYDLGAYLAAADREAGWTSAMMAARQSQALQLAEYQAVVDLCAAFQPGAFECGRHYRGVDVSEDRLAGVLAENAADQYPSYARLLVRMVERGVL